MVNIVRISARLNSTALGGVSCMPLAWRNIDSTMTIRVKAVMTIRMAGAMLKTVNKRQQLDRGCNLLRL